MQLGIFYIVAMCIIVITFAASIAFKNTELRKRCLTLLLLLNITSIVILLGQLPFMLFVFFIAAIGAIEITGLPKLRFGNAAAALITVLVLFFACKLYINTVWFLLPVIPAAFTVLLITCPKSISTKVLTWVCLIAVIIPGFVALSILFDKDLVHIIAVLLFVQFNDGFSYLVGKKAGKTKLKYINTISPNKTFEGYIGGLFGILLALLLLNSIINVYPGDNFIARSLILVFTVFIFANIGDLVFSSIKRKLGIKDFSNLLSGHGGVLDRFDSTVFLAPVYLFLLLGGII